MSGLLVEGRVLADRLEDGLRKERVRDEPQVLFTRKRMSDRPDEDHIALLLEVHHLRRRGQVEIPTHRLPLGEGPTDSFRLPAVDARAHELKIHDLLGNGDVEPRILLVHEDLAAVRVVDHGDIRRLPRLVHVGRLGTREARHGHSGRLRDDRHAQIVHVLHLSVLVEVTGAAFVEIDTGIHVGGEHRPEPADHSGRRKRTLHNRHQVGQLHGARPTRLLEMSLGDLEELADTLPFRTMLIRIPKEPHDGDGVVARGKMTGVKADHERPLAFESQELFLRLHAHDRNRRLHVEELAAVDLEEPGVQVRHHVGTVRDHDHVEIRARDERCADFRVKRQLRDFPRRLARCSAQVGVHECGDEVEHPLLTHVTEVVERLHELAPFGFVLWVLIPVLILTDVGLEAFGCQFHDTRGDRKIEGIDGERERASTRQTVSVFFVLVTLAPAESDTDDPRVVGNFLEFSLGHEDDFRIGEDTLQKPSRDKLLYVRLFMKCDRVDVARLESKNTRVRDHGISRGPVPDLRCSLLLIGLIPVKESLKELAIK